MNHKDGKFAGARSESIYYRYWTPQEPARAVLLVAHGAGEHCGRYEHLAEFFTQQGFAVAALDHSGHGHSDGVSGFVAAFDDYIDTLEIFQRQVNTDLGPLPIILLGHSMGGLISARYLLDHQRDYVACVLSGPAIKSDLEPGFVQMTIIRLLSALIPKAGVLQLDANDVCRDPEVVRKYKEDPLVHHGKLSARLVEELFKAMNKVQVGAHTLSLPMLMLHGSEDKMASPAGSHFLNDNIASTQKEMKIYPGLYHEIFNEPEHPQVMRDILDWLESALELPRRAVGGSQL
ncbi:MAG: alpha-beta hydrolase superfamily lysophospholipase [Halioglobus sp.]|jgi:alpha-beta hydrolase superfamily lysophospholipase